MDLRLANVLFSIITCLPVKRVRTTHFGEKNEGGQCLTHIIGNVSYGEKNVSPLQNVKKWMARTRIHWVKPHLSTTKEHTQSAFAFHGARWRNNFHQSLGEKRIS